MRRIPRVNGTPIALHSRIIRTSNTSICFACRLQATSYSTSTESQAKEKQSSFTQGLRKRIWGVDNPPGPEDPYSTSQLGETRVEGEPSVDTIVDSLEINRGELERSKRSERQQEEKQREELMKNYEPSNSWDGLEVIGDRRPQLTEGNHYSGFMPKNVSEDTEEVVIALHRAVVEAHALRQAGQPLAGISKNIATDVDWTVNVNVIPTASGTTLEFSQGATLDDVVQQLIASPKSTIDVEAPTESQEDVEADRSTEDPLHPEATEDEVNKKRYPTESEEDVVADRSREDPLETSEGTYVRHSEIIASWNPAWLETSVEDLDLKFSILKRVTQLTGIRIADTAIQPSNTVKTLLSHLVKPPKPDKLIDALGDNQALKHIPNLFITGKKITSYDRQTMLGRQKLIDAELTKRGLPLFGENRARTLR
ncbi:ribosomal subunit 39S-domain-containing protein [Amylocarpus encephaloides]|uniref:Large ribosomal subunit protein mL50 n=1 Tax=Amylocarpus encephaloides TaxID=45428 RepID=A0A9P8C569_9HELO|nr:ribosomal subunit 39S-domain-containing protein [Amylocarpus encephaloides]